MKSDSSSRNGAKRIGIWIRVSTEDQALGESPEHHEFRARQYAAFQGWPVVEIYDLAGVSGKSVWEHPECQRMLRDVKRGHIHGLIFSKLARLARNTRELLDFAEVFEAHKAALVSIEEKIDTTTPAGLLFYTMLGAIAQWEREEIAARVRSSVQVRAKLGKPLSGAAPYGFKWQDKKLVREPVEAEIRRLAFELFLEHRRKGTVARILNTRGYRTRQKHRFKDTQVNRLLRCPSAKGVYRINTVKRHADGKLETKPESEWGHIPCEPIVSEAVFDRVSQILEEQYKPAAKPAKKPAHTFAGIVKCACGGKMYVYTRSPNYTCTVCKNKIAAVTLDELFVTTIADTLGDTSRVSDQLDHAKQRIAERQKEAGLAREQITAVRAEMKKVYDLYISGAVDVERFKALNQPLETQLQELNENLPRLEGEIAAMQVNDLSVAAIAKEARDLGSLWPTLDVEGKQRIASLMCSSIIVPQEDADAPIEVALRHAPATNPSQDLNRLNTPQNLGPECQSGVPSHTSARPPPAPPPVCSAPGSWPRPGRRARGHSHGRCRCPTSLSPRAGPLSPAEPPCLRSAPAPSPNAVEILLMLMSSWFDVVEVLHQTRIPA
ncbi:MAG: recombinase family protein [Verrucomicrobiaceae bacterium]|nr:recombinase family protein [Verrucomicrobiaceae bacterium]